MLAGHTYNKAVRGHKLPFEALWQILWPQFENWVSQNGKRLDDSLRTKVDHVIKNFKDQESDEAIRCFDELLDTTAGMLDLLHEFDSSQKSCSSFTYWRHYMEMVAILLGFIRAEREGNWEMHLELFSRMLPYFALFDHTNYARWGPVYLADMQNLVTTAPEVHNEFMAGKFSVKRTDSKFCQIPTDQALEHINRVAKVSGGLVGITHLEAARDRWCLTYNERSRIADDTLALYNLQSNDSNDDFSHRDTGPAGIQRDKADVNSLVREFKRLGVVSKHSESLVCLSTGDVAPEDVRDELLSAEVKGTSLVIDFVKSHLIDRSVDFYSRIPQNKAKTLATMYKVKVPVQKDKVIEVKAERDIFHRLLVASGSGRDVNLENILKHELSPVPLALAKTNRQLLSAKNKADLQSILIETTTAKIETNLPKSSSPTCLLIDAPALIQAISKPEKANTFGDLADVFSDIVKGKFGKGYSRVDV